MLASDPTLCSVHLEVEFAGKKSVKPFYLEKCLYGCSSKLELLLAGKGYHLSSNSDWG